MLVQVKPFKQIVEKELNFVAEMECYCNRIIEVEATFMSLYKQIGETWLYHPDWIIPVTSEIVRILYEQNND